MRLAEMWILSVGGYDVPLLPEPFPEAHKWKSPSGLL